MQAETNALLADAIAKLADVVSALVESQKIPTVPADAPLRDIVDESQQWLDYEKARLQQMGQDITPEIAARLQERASAMKVFNG